MFVSSGLTMVFVRMVFQDAWKLLGNVGRTNLLNDLSVGNHGNYWFYQQFP